MFDALRDVYGRVHRGQGGVLTEILTVQNGHRDKEDTGYVHRAVEVVLGDLVLALIRSDSNEGTACHDAPNLFSIVNSMITRKVIQDSSFEPKSHWLSAKLWP